MYSNISERYKKSIYNTSLQSVVNIYLDDILLNPKYLLDFKTGCELFDDELQLGSVPSQYIEMQIHKKAVINKPKIIRIEYGILVNNALTVEGVNKMLVKDLNKLLVRSLSKYNNSFEMIPIGIYNIDDYNEEDDNVINIKALDNIIKLDADDGYYDASELINENGEVTLGELAQDICNKKGLELVSSSFLNSNKKVSVYDNQLTAREYMSYIGECAGCFCKANREGKIEFRKIGQDTVEIPLRLFKNYKFGEEYKISKVAYEDGIRSFKFGNETRNTLWIRQDNIFIVDEEEIQNIYNQVNGLTINSFEGTVIIDPSIDIGDQIIIDGKPIIYQGEASLNKRFIVDIRSKINIKEKQETTVKQESKKILNRRIQSEINQLDGKITQIVEQQTENTSKISEHTQTIEGFTDRVISVENISKEMQSTDSSSGNFPLKYENSIGLNLFRFEADGNSLKNLSQKNLFENTFVSTTKNGITLTVNDDKLHIEGTATANTNIRVNKKIPSELLGKTVTLTAFGIENSGINNIGFKGGTPEYNVFIVTTTQKSNTKQITQTMINNSNVFDIFIVNGTTVNGNIYIQLEEGTETTDYEPYKIIPSPDNPAPIYNINNVVDSENTLDIVTTNSNMYYLDDDNFNRLGLNTTINKNKWSISGTSNIEGFLSTNNKELLYLPPNNYTFKFNYNGNIVKNPTLASSDIYLIGGTNSKTTLYKYNILTNEYTQLTNIPYEFYQGSAVAIGTDIYLFGGTDSNTTVYKYNTLINEYVQLTNIPYAFSRGSAVVIDTDIYLIGGINSPTKLYKYNTLTNEYIQLTDIPYNFRLGSAVAIDTDIYLLGGTGALGKKAYKYNTLTDEYTQLTDIPYIFTSSSAVAIGTDIYLFGGTGAGNGNITAYKYNILTGEYTQLTNIPYTFDNGSVIAIDTDIYLFGGTNSKTTLYKYNILTNEYTQLTNIPYEFYQGSAVAVTTQEQSTEEKLDLLLYGKNLNNEKTILVNANLMDNTSQSFNFTTTESMLISTNIHIYNNYTINIQIDMSITKTEDDNELIIIPKQNILKVDLGNEFLGKVNDSTDKFYIDENGVAHIEKKVGKVVLDGNQLPNYVEYKTDTYRFNFKIIGNSKKISKNKIICDKFISAYGDTEDYEHCRNGDGSEIYYDNIVIYINKSRLADISTETDMGKRMTSWLQSNPVTIYYELETPYIVDLGYVSIPTYEGNGYILINSIVNSEYGYCDYFIDSDLTQKFLAKSEKEVILNITDEKIESSVSEINTELGSQSQRISTIEQTADSITLEVQKKADKDNLISQINLSTEGIKISGNKIDIAGQAVSFTTNIDAGYTYTSEDATRANKIAIGAITANASDIDKLDVTGDGKITTADAEIINRAVNQNNGKIDGTFQIDPYSAKRSIILKDYNGNIATSMGLYGMKTNNLDVSVIKASSIGVDRIGVSEIITKGGNEVLGQTTLYDNSSGSSGSITLNDYAYNYDYLEIYYTDISNSNPENFAKVTDPNGKTATLQISNPGTSNMRLNSKRVLISGDSILYDDGAVAFAPGNECYKVDEIKIIKVVGYK